MSSLRPLPSRVEAPKQMEIVLTDTESQICALFDECTQFLKKRFSIDTSCRVAGGWVRDKVPYRAPRFINTSSLIILIMNLALGC
jgi:hypothetical protein